MGSSNKKKKEKKKDFQKAKLKVGKAKPKASNFTDTSFKSKSIVVNQQSLSSASTPFPDQFKQHLHLCTTAKSDTARRDALAYITNHLSYDPLPVGIPQILTRLLPLLTDVSVPVRTQLLKLLSSLPAASIPPHVTQILLYVRSGLTHLAPSVRHSSLSALEWLLSVAGPQTVSSPGGWLKTLTSFSSMLGWNPSVSSAMATKGWSVGIKPVLLGKTSTKKGEPELKARQLEVLAKFIAEGLREEEQEEDSTGRQGVGREEAEMYRNNLYRLPTQPNPFAYLNLFGIPRDEENEMYLDMESRKRVFDVKWRQVIEKGKEDARKEGGTVGRAAAALHRALNGTAGGTVIVGSLRGSKEEETEDQETEEEEEDEDDMDEDED